MEASAGPRLMRWNMWAQGHSRETLDWIREHPAESDWIYQHQKLAAWAKTFPEKAKLVDDHPDLLAYLEWNPAARQIQQGQPGLARIYELGEANHWGAPELSQGPGGDDGNPPPTMAEIRRSLMEEEGLTGEDLERALREAEGRLKAGTIRGPRPREDN